MERVLLLRSFFTLLCCLALAVAFTPFGKKRDKCESMKFGFCRSMNYNRTIFPNYLDQRKQSDAHRAASQLNPLVATQCSAQSLYFICAVYFPMCTSVDKIIPPCRELCETVYKGCLPVLKRFGYSWPTQLKCDQFPRLNTKICVYYNSSGVAKPDTKATAPTTTKRKVKGARKTIQRYCPSPKRLQAKKLSKVCACCQRGARAARNGAAKCTLKRGHSKDIRGSKSFQKTLKQCRSRRHKRAYLNCCNAKRREAVKKAKAKQRKKMKSNKKNRKSGKKPFSG